MSLPGISAALHCVAESFWRIGQVLDEEDLILTGAIP
jgi:hypothetical protein